MHKYTHMYIDELDYKNTEIIRITKRIIRIQSNLSQIALIIYSLKRTLKNSEIPPPPPPLPKPTDPYI